MAPVLEVSPVGPVYPVVPIPLEPVEPSIELYVITKLEIKLLVVIINLSNTIYNFYLLIINEYSIFSTYRDRNQLC